MFITKVEPKLVVPFTEGTVVTVLTASSQEIDLTLDNLDLINTLTFKWQSSPDGATWTDVATFATLAPGIRNVTTVSVASATHYRLRASGLLNVALKVDAQRAWASDISLDCDGRFQSKVQPEVTVTDTSSSFVSQFTVSAQPSQSVRVSVENTGAVQLDGIKFQSSPDKIVWTDEAAPVPLPSGSTLKFTLTGKPFYRCSVDTTGTTLGVKADAEVLSTSNIISVSRG